MVSPVEASYHSEMCPSHVRSQTFISQKFKEPFDINLCTVSNPSMQAIICEGVSPGGEIKQPKERDRK